jgi:hypothetical protein
MSFGPAESMYPDSAPLASVTSGIYTLGTQFTVDVDGQITHLRYHHSASCGGGIHYLSLWLGGYKAASASDSSPAGYPGWVNVALPTPLSVTAGQVYRVAFSVDGQATDYSLDMPPPDAAPNLTRSMAEGGWYNTVPDTQPVYQIPTWHTSADVVFKPGTPGPSEVWPIAIAPGEGGGEVYEQDDEPVGAVEGDIWIETDEVIVPGVGPTGPEGPAGPAGPAGEWTQVTQAEYDALSPPDPATLYVIIG